MWEAEKVLNRFVCLAWWYFFIVLSQMGKNDYLCMLEDIYWFLWCCVCPLQTTIPKAVNSLKVLAELPIIVVLMYQVSNKSTLESFGRLLWSSAGRRYSPGSNYTLLVAPIINNNCWLFFIIVFYWMTFLWLDIQNNQGGGKCYQLSWGW